MQSSIICGAPQFLSPSRRKSFGLLPRDSRQSNSSQTPSKNDLMNLGKGDGKMRSSNMKRCTDVMILILSLFLSGFFMTAQATPKRLLGTTRTHLPQQQSPLIRPTDKQGSVKPQA